MKAAILAQSNYYGLIGSLEAGLNRLEGVEARAIIYEPSKFYPDPNVPLSNLDPKELPEIIQYIQAADVVHIFNKGFNLQELDQNGNLVRNANIEGRLKTGSLLYTYTPDFFNENWHKIFFRHYRQNIPATCWPVNPYSLYCPLPLIHIPPVLDLEHMSKPVLRKNNGRAAAAVSTHYGDRHHIEGMLDSLMSVRGRADFSINWLENLKREDYLIELESADIFIDSFRFTGLTPMALEAMSKGVTVVSNVTGLDMTLYAGAPIVPARLNEIGDVIADLVQDRDKLNARGKASAEWIADNMKPEEAVLKWLNLYRHVINGGEELNNNGHD